MEKPILQAEITPLPSAARLRPLPTRWRWRDCPAGQVATLMRQTGLPELLARILTARGVNDPEQAWRFLNPGLAHLHDPHLMRGMDAAVDRIARAVERRQPVCVYGDYDADGVTATSILLLTLRELTDAVDYYIPHRLNEGYGLNREALEQIAAGGARLIITVDCGITSFAEARHARQLGLDLIITDHHEAEPDLPEACAVLNPKQPGCAYPCKVLSGAGVAFKLSHALLKRCHPDPAAAREFLKGLLDLVALGTVADMVPLVDENRPLVAHGLALMRSAPRTGLLQLLDCAGVAPANVDAGVISFGLAPRLNAAGRTQHAMYGVELLLTDNPRQARDLAHQLDQFNDDRRDIEKEILDQALELIDPASDDPVIVVAQEGWHAGVLGIVASRILNLYYRPTIIINTEDGTARGSGRSIPGFDLHQALTHCRSHLIQYGGHKMAAGMELATDAIAPFREAINAFARSCLTDELLSPTIEIDAQATSDDLTPQTIERLADLAPHGFDNPKPVVALLDYTLLEPPRFLKDRHLKLKLAGPDGSTLVALAWNMAHRALELNPGQAFNLAGTPIINTWGGQTAIEFELKDFQSAP